MPERVSKMTEEFRRKTQTYAAGGLISLAMAVANKIGLLKALYEVSTPENPVGPCEVARVVNCGERYVKELLSCLACAEIIEVNEEEKFWIAEEKEEDLIHNPHMNILQFSYLPIYAGGLGKLEDAFRNENPRLGLDYSDFSGFHDLINVQSAAMHAESLIPKLLPDIGHGIVERLTSPGLICLDVGCGNGVHVGILAKHFQSSNFTGLDISQSAIEAANQKRDEEGIENLDFIESDASRMPTEWSNKFDLVTIFDSCHDQIRPDLCVKEIYRVLKPGGIFAMVEVRGSSNVHTDKSQDGIMAAWLYGTSLVHCLPIASNAPDALCLGLKWGTERGRRLLNECGFENVTVEDLPYYPLNCLYVCKK